MSADVRHVPVTVEGEVLFTFTFTFTLSGQFVALRSHSRKWFEL